ncbi:CRISPR-associated DxTHG motif protein, partial [bacterium]|nr:CRISPR-associated DxTHG motif protein [bacterium]
KRFLRRHQCLLKMNLSCQIQAVLIPNGKSEGEIWEIFNLVCDQLGEKDEVVLDVTHALRSLPLLAKVVLQYMRVLKDVVLNGIFFTGDRDILFSNQS